jgi:hypothetical protein
LYEVNTMTSLDEKIAAREAYAFSTVVSDSPHSVLRRMFSCQGMRLDPDNVEAAATSIAAYLQWIGVMPSQPQPVAVTSVRSRSICYSCFISYRATADKTVAESLYDKLRVRGYNPFLDKFSMASGESWERGFRLGLARSRVFLPLMSSAGLSPLRDATRNHSGDNVLLEYQIALGLLNDFGGSSSSTDGDSFHIYPVLVGARDGSTLNEFSAFIGYSSTLDASPSVLNLREDTLNLLNIGIVLDEPGLGPVTRGNPLLQLNEPLADPRGAAEFGVTDFREFLLRASMNRQKKWGRIKLMIVGTYDMMLL